MLQLKRYLELKSRRQTYCIHPAVRLSWSSFFSSDVQGSFFPYFFLYREFCLTIPFQIGLVVRNFLSFPSLRMSYFFFIPEEYFHSIGFWIWWYFLSRLWNTMLFPSVCDFWWEKSQPQLLLPLCNMPFWVLLRFFFIFNFWSLIMIYHSMDFWGNYSIWGSVAFLNPKGYVLDKLAVSVIITSSIFSTWPSFSFPSGTWWHKC